MARRAKTKGSTVPPYTMNVVLILISLIIFAYLVKWFFSKEKYDAKEIDLVSCPRAIYYKGVGYQNLPKYTNTIVGGKSGYGFCYDNDLKACVYGKGCTSKTFSQGKKGGRGKNHPVCGNDHWGETHNMCDKDMVVVHFKKNPGDASTGSKPTFIKQITASSNDCSNYYGVSNDDGFDNINTPEKTTLYDSIKECNNYDNTLTYPPDLQLVQ